LYRERRGLGSVSAMRISARNQLHGTIVAIEDGAVTSIVTIELAGSDRVVSSITRESVANLNLTVGLSVCAVIKSSDVMVAVE
jgi:molybdopterin-binding protein